MSNAIEIEAKALITQDEYRKIVKAFPECRRYSQTNYYIDNDERILAKEGIALRIREKGGIYELTLKTQLSQGLLEKTKTIGMNEFTNLRDFGDFPHGDLEQFLIMLDIDVTQLKILTSLTTERVDVPYKGGLLSIDRNVYSGITDYEIEFEYNNLEGAKAIMARLFQENQIPVNFTTASKVSRAMAAIGK